MPTRPNDPPVLIVAVRVFPRSRRNDLTLAGDTLRARLTAPPVDGAANAALLAFLAERLGIPRRNVALLRGASARDKLVSLSDLTWDELRERVPHAAAGA